MIMNSSTVNTEYKYTFSMYVVVIHNIYAYGAQSLLNITSTLQHDRVCLHSNIQDI